MSGPIAYAMKMASDEFDAEHDRIWRDAAAHFEKNKEAISKRVQVSLRRLMKEQQP